MSDILESLQIQTRPGDNTGVGTIIATLDENGLVLNSAYPLKSGNAVVNPYHNVEVTVLAAAVDIPIFIPQTGVWVVDRVASIRRVVGSDAGAVTADVMSAPSGTAPASGTTQLASADSINLKSPAADIIANHALATTPTEVGPGSYFGLNVAGTLTAVVALIQVRFRRVR